MKAVSLYYKMVNGLGKLKSIPLLLIRLILAYGFYVPAKMKWADINGIAQWFKEMHIPAPTVNAYMAATTEAIGVVLLILGLGTRLITVPLMIVMLVAIKTVHWHNGFEAGENGFEIPLYYLIMLMVLFVYGGGKISLDHVIANKFRKRTVLSFS